jgi:hypothetical protein
VPCVLDWTDQLTRAVEDLPKAVVVSYVSEDEITSLIAPCLIVAVSILGLRRSAPSGYLLFVP